MSKLDDLDALSATVDFEYRQLEEDWIQGHRIAQQMVDALGISPVTPLGLIDFITRGLDDSFERETIKLYAEFDRCAARITGEEERS